jgi:diguanylate cyclase (GGDEF)-like protein
MQPVKPKSLIRDLIYRFGVVKVMIGATLLSVILSVLIMIALNLLLRDGISADAFLIAAITPAIIAPLLSYHSFKMLAELDIAERKLQALSTTDELTGAFNRRYFMDLALHELERCERYHSDLSIAIMDFDNFKAINDHHGHLAGDQALRGVSDVCREMIRITDIFARYGGDEFIFMFPQTNEHEACECLQRIIEKIAALSFEYQGRTICARVSIGLHSFSPKSQTLDEILEKADLALYKSKQMGGNRMSW